MPGLADAEIRQMINGPESFTPDSRYLLGEVPEVWLFSVHLNFRYLCSQNNISFR